MDNPLNDPTPCALHGLGPQGENSWAYSLSFSKKTAASNQGRFRDTQTATGTGAYTTAPTAAQSIGTNGANPSAYGAINGYIGGLADTISNLTHLGARELDPATGIFTAPDPLLDANDPNNFSPYQYSNQDPINNSDPSGLRFTSGEGGGGGRGGGSGMPVPGYYGGGYRGQQLANSTELMGDLQSAINNIGNAFESGRARLQPVTANPNYKIGFSTPRISSTPGYRSYAITNYTYGRQIYNTRSTNGSNQAGGGGGGIYYDFNAIKAANEAARAQSQAVVDETGRANTSAAAGVAINRVNGNAARDALAAQYPRAKTEAYFYAEGLGGRFVDILIGRHAIESKIGRTGLSSLNQVVKDAALKNAGDIGSVEWVFGRSPITGKIGPTTGLQKALEAHGIPWRLIK